MMRGTCIDGKVLYQNDESSTQIGSTPVDGYRPRTWNSPSRDGTQSSLRLRNAANPLIFSFHIPMFFSSGILSPQGQDIASDLLQRARRLLVLHGLTGLLLYLLQGLAEFSGLLFEGPVSVPL